MVSYKAKLMAEVMLLAMQVQEETGHAVFIRFSGHVDSINIEITESQDNWQNKLADSTFSTKSEYTIERLEKVKETLLGFLEEGVDTEQLDYWVEEVYHYTF